MLAHHFTAAGLSERGVFYWQRAGQQASDRSAYLEATRHFNTGIELLKTLPDTPARTQQELTLHVALGAALIAHQRPRLDRGGACLSEGARVV